MSGMSSSDLIISRKMHLSVAGIKGVISAGTVHSGLDIASLPMSKKRLMSNQHYLIDGDIESQAGSDTFLSWNTVLNKWQV
jgi:hypothetical protein